MSQQHGMRWWLRLLWGFPRHADQHGLHAVPNNLDHLPCTQLSQLEEAKHITDLPSSTLHIPCALHVKHLAECVNAAWGLNDLLGRDT